jgi:hypothetical protein
MLKLSSMMSIQTVCDRGLWIAQFDWARFERLCLAFAAARLEGEKFFLPLFCIARPESAPVGVWALRPNAQ